MNSAGPIHADCLKSFIERIERLETERKAIGGDIRDVYAEAKGVGYDVKTMRRIVQLRKQDAADRDEAEALLDVYAHALGMVIGGTGVGAITVAREPTEDELMVAAGRIAREVDRCLALAIGGDIPKIADIQALIGCSAGKASKLRRMTVERAEALVAISRSQADLRENETGDAAPPPDLVCVVDDGRPCPNTCEREGRCVWAGAGDQPAPLSVPVGVSGPSFYGDQPEVGIPISVGAVTGRGVDAPSTPPDPEIDLTPYHGLTEDNLELPPFLDRRESRRVTG